MRRVSALLFAVLALAATGLTALALSSVAAASEGTTYSPETPVVDTIEGGPWNTSQGDPSAGGEYPSSDLLPTFAFGGPETTLGGVSEPNVAVYPGESGATVPYPSGVAGTPGPLDGYCNTEESENEKGSPVSQPANTAQPFSPYYFPDVVRNADGSLTGYFDYRPKDTEEAITVARSTNNGASWTAEGKALGENSGYCPTADANDDGQGHPYVMSAGGSTNLYTLQRPAGDNAGIGLLVHPVNPAATDPLEGLPANQPVGVDPNTFATSSEVEVPTSGTGAAIPVSTLGEAGSPEHIVAGPYEDYNAASPSSSIITCGGVSASPGDELTECKVTGSPLTVHAGDDLVQVIAKAEKAVSIPVGPNKSNGEGGLESLKFTNGNSTVSPLTTYLMNLNAPNRVYIDGATVYCSQSNANPTTKLEFCTNTGSKPLAVETGAAITADPIIPPGTATTTGLIAPDGIVGTLPKYPGAPEGSTVVLYTEKILSYYIEGTTNGFVEGSTYKKGTIKLPGAGTVTINYTPSVAESEQPLPASGSYKIYLGTTETAPIQELTCTGVTTATQLGVPAGSRNLAGCTGGSGEVKEGNWVGGPNAATVPFETLNKIGEGKSGSKGPEKLFSNNEDYSVLRAAYTTNGVEFHDLGAISGTASASGKDSGGYNDVSNPNQQASPESSANPTTATTSPASPANLTSGSADEIELRYIGSRGTIITNPNGTYGMFLSGAWASDGDSDAFNQIFYTESSNGKEWSVPKVVLSTEYKFAASAAQDKALEEGKDEPLGISAYYSGRAYGPAVVQNPDGSLTMVFSGYRLPKPVEKQGTKFGTNATAQYTIGKKDPALYRNILTMHLTTATSPGVSTSTSVTSSDGGTGLLGAPVTYTATVTPEPPGAGTPTGTVSFSDSNGPIGGCSAQPLNKESPDTATCVTTHEAPSGPDTVTATYSGDSNYAGSSGTTGETVQEAPAITSAESTTFTEGTAGSFTVTASGYPTPLIDETAGQLPGGVEFNPLTDALSGTPTEAGVYHITFEATNGVGANAIQSFTLTVDAAPAITSADEATFNDHSNSTFTVTSTGMPTPGVVESGKLPAGVTYTEGTGALAGTGVLSGTPTQIGTYQITFTAANGIGADSVQQFTLTVAGLHVTTASLPEATPGEPYSKQLEAAGGIAPYHWKRTPGSTALPKGLKLNSAGLLSGSLKAKAYPHGGSFPIEVTVTDTTKKVRQTATARLVLVARSAPDGDGHDARRAG